VAKAGTARLAPIADQLAKLEQQYTRLADLEAITQKVNRQVVGQLTATIRRMLVSNYEKSGLHQESGDLIRAACGGAVVVVTPKGIKIKMASGFDKSVYVRGSVHNKYMHFYQLTGDQIAEIQTLYVKFWQAEVNRIVGVKGGTK
jgi:hypothetical protein